MDSNLSVVSNSNIKRIILVFKSFLVGILASLVVVAFRFTLIYAEKFSIYIYSFQSSNKWFIPLWFAALAIIGFLVGKLTKREPFISGSGIPQVKAVMGGYLNNRPLSIIINKFIGGALSILGGLSLGREGPSVQLGACCGDIVSNKTKSSSLERKLLISSGASAGLSAAFNAPLAGVMFSLEEIYKYFSPLVILSTITASITADFISKEFFGLSPIFNFKEVAVMPLNHYFVLIILGLILGVLGVIYNWTLLNSQKLYKKIKLPAEYKVIIAFIFAGIIGLIFPQLICGGSLVLNELTLSNAISFLILLAAGKFLFSMVSFGSGAPGGIFFPLLIIGGGIGAIIGAVSIKYLGMPAEFFSSFIILSMVGYFTAIVRAPITGVILISEMSGSFSHFLPLSIVAIISYIIADCFKCAPIYDSLMDNLLAGNKNTTSNNLGNDKTIITAIVHHGSKLDKISIDSIKLPENTLIVSLERGASSIIPKGNTIIKAGDEVSIMTDQKEEAKIRELLNYLSSIE